MLTHDIKNPLTSLLGYTDYLLENAGKLEVAKREVSPGRKADSDSTFIAAEAPQPFSARTESDRATGLSRSDKIHPAKVRSNCRRDDNSSAPPAPAHCFPLGRSRAILATAQMTRKPAPKIPRP